MFKIISILGLICTGMAVKFVFVFFQNIKVSLWFEEYLFLCALKLVRFTIIPQIIQMASMVADIIDTDCVCVGSTYKATF